MQEHIFQGRAPKLSKAEAKITTPTKNYLSHHREKKHKPNKIRIAFDAGAKIQYE